ncbi:MAG: hypothetical protein KAV42_11380, partial [Candidatus Krumholzibacteria bacterium]|nr:hypothetical protein [Candidatus Krumholzibacteria bacterium]
MRVRGISAAATMESGSGKVSAAASTTASTASSSVVIYSIESYRKFYVREAREKIRSSSSSLSRLSEISLLSDGELLKTVRQTRITEKKMEISMLLYLIEVERRGLDLSGGYNSLFAFCTKHLKYSDSVAGRRIRAARCMRDYPAVYEYLSAGKVNVCNISEAAKIMTERNHLSLLGQISGRSTSYVRVLVSGHQPAIVIRDRVTPVKVFEKEFVKEPEKANEKDPGGGKKFITTGGDKKACTSFVSSTGEGSVCESEGSIRVKTVQKFKLQFAVSPEFMTKYKRVKVLMSTKYPGGIDFEGVFESLMDEYIERHSPEAREKRREARAAKKKVNPPAKVVKKKVKTAVKVERAKNE